MSVVAASSVVHLNVVDFQAAVAVAADRGLAGRPFVIAGAASAARAIVLGLSRGAREAGLAVGMSLAAAERHVPGLLVMPPDPVSCARAESAMVRIAGRWAPLVQDDSGGHLFLDLAGTGRIFGAAIDCAVRIRNEMVDSLGLEPTVSVAANMLVAKVAARSIRPAGVAYVRRGDEAAFMSPQDAALLPGVGPAISRVLSVAGIQEIGQLASLSDFEAVALFGKRALALRDAALGIDPTPVARGGLGERAIRRRVDFGSDEIDARAIRAALVAAAEDAGLELRRSLLAAGRLLVVVQYADGCRAEASERPRSPWVLDAELLAAADRTFARAATRRVRLRALALELSALSPARREPDLFVPEGPGKLARLQAAVDRSRTRFGPAAVTRACAIVPSREVFRSTGVVSHAGGASRTGGPG
ncbi:MAG: DNA polymerase [Spirochaetae bacterium HGW-Spirochaetae-7]|nr:MAG: DNA polymerase [Spirochaetae bacterium HGW-Spirochaetae-7]